MRLRKPIPTGIFMNRGKSQRAKGKNEEEEGIFRARKIGVIVAWMPDYVRHDSTVRNR